MCAGRLSQRQREQIPPRPPFTARGTLFHVKMYFSFLFPFRSGALPTRAHRSTLSPRPSSDIRAPNSLAAAPPSRSHTPDPADGGSASFTVLRTATINFAGYLYLTGIQSQQTAQLAMHPGPVHDS